MKFNYTLILIMLACLSAQAQNYLNLETQVPTNWSTSPGGQLSVSNKHFKRGSESIQWNWQAGSVITIDQPAGMKAACNTYKGGMMLWIYNETPSPQALKFEYLDSNSTTQYYFSYNLNYKGWRACWIRFKEDMKGAKNNTDLKSMRITAPSSQEGGALFFDRMKFPGNRINDRVTPDAQLPEINPTMNFNHWAALWHWHSSYQYELPLPTSVTAKQTSDFAEIRNRITTNVKGKVLSTSLLNSTRNTFQSLNINRTDDNITGVPFVSQDEYVKTENNVRLQELDELIHNIAKGWYHNKAEGFDQMFVDLLDWLYDQGLTTGSGIGANHHYGYSFRGFPKAIWLMQDVLKDAGEFDEAVEMIQYWTGVPEIRQAPTPDNFQGIVDTWNTILPGRLIAIMLQNDSPELLRDVQSYSRWVSLTLVPSVGTMGGIKPDGAGFHHGMLYANYLNGGYSGLGAVMNYIGGTEFNLTASARKLLGKGLKTMSRICNLRSYPNSVSGRHPLNQSISNGAINAMGYLAKAGNPDTGETIDRDMAATFMRMTAYKKDLYNEFKGLGITAETTPSGNWTVNYGALNIHRRDNWTVTMKGFNKIVTGMEIYSSNNRYGRYQGYGALQIMANGNPVSASTSGFKENGWDWNRFPGTTTIHLPFDDLELWKSNHNERSAHEEFAGSCSLSGENGIFGMKLHENDNPNYTADFVARKSAFFFGNRIICLGSGISNSNSSYETETTLFQVSLSNQSSSITINDQQTTQFPYKQNYKQGMPAWMIDTKGQGYYIPKNDITISRKNQLSRNNKNRSETNGDFASAWINHGKAPNNEEYEYAILMQTSANKMKQFADSMLLEDAPYKVLRKDNDAHIVFDKSSNTTGYVLFESGTSISNGTVDGSSYPCLVMVKENADQSLNLSMADPAINMETPTALVHQAVAKERKITLALNGIYKLSQNTSNCTVKSTSDGQTTLEFTCIHGIPIEVRLSPDTTASSDDIKSGNENVRIYSSQGKLIIESEQNKDACLEVFDTSGHRIIAKRISGIRNEIPISATGVLVVSYIASEESYTEKVVVVE